MNKKYFTSWLCVFVAWMAGSFLVHGVLLHDDYAKLPNLFRSETDSQAYFPLMLLAHIILAGALVWIYQMTQHAKSQARAWPVQGLQFGLVIAMLHIVPAYMIYYVVQPMPGITVIKQIILDGTLLVLLGVLLGFLYRSKEGIA
jgi:hypothetical protein